MIFWGSKGKTKVIGEGNFFCPRCRTNRPYKHKEVGRYFTLYFIPIFQTKKLGGYIECQFCNTPFEKSVLNYDPQMQQVLHKTIQKIQEQINAGMPVNAIYQGLIETGASEEFANNLISTATNGEFKFCTNCQLVYSATLSFCSKCGKSLSLQEEG